MAEFTQGQTVNVDVGVEMTGGLAGTITGLFKMGTIERYNRYEVPAYGSLIVGYDNITLDLSPGSYMAEVTLTHAVTGEVLGHASGTVTIKEAAVYKMALRILNISVDGQQIYSG